MSCEISAENRRRHNNKTDLVAIFLQKEKDTRMKTPPRQLPSLINQPFVKCASISIKKAPDSDKQIKNAVTQIINRQTKTSLTPIISKSKVYDTIAPQAEVVPECLNLSSMTSLGERDSTQILQGDILSALAFDTTGKFLSIGDYGGRCIIFSEVLDEDC